ncbi:MAG: histidine kinase N-terminal 7TM domain-containing protein [Smithellaceae bacterium]
MDRFYILYFISILLVVLAMGFIADYARRHRNVSGACAYMWTSLGVCLLAVFEGLSMISPSKDWALFWFNLRYLCFAPIPVVWLIFVLQYLGQARLITKARVAVLFIIPVITQVMLWTNSLHGLWVKRDVDFYQGHMFFIADTSVRIPALWMKVHLLYTYALMLAGLIILSVMTVRLYRKDRRQALILGAGTLIMILGSLFPTFNLLPGSSFNPLMLGMAAGSLVIAWDVFRHGFLERAPVVGRGKHVYVALAATFFALTGAIVLSGYVYYRQFEKNYHVEVERKLSAIVELKVEELVLWRKERLADASVLHNNIAVVKLVRQVTDEPLNHDAQKRMRAWLLKFHSAYQYSNVLLLDASGVLRMSAADVTGEEYRDIKMHISDMPSWNRIDFVDFYRAAPGKPVQLLLLIPIVDHGHRLGVVALLIDPVAYLYPMLQRWPTPSKTGETLLVRREGDDVLYLNELKFQKNTALTLRFSLKKDALPSAMAVLGHKGVMEGDDYRGEHVIAALSAVPDSPWFMVARIDTAEIFAPIRERFWMMVFFMGILIAGAGAIVWLIWQRQSGIFYRRELESAKVLEASEEKFRKAFTTSPDAIAITRLTDGLLVSVNTGFLRLAGYSEDEIACKTVPEIHIWEDDRDRQRMIDQLEKESIVNNFESRFLKKNGDMVYGLTSASLIELGGVPHVLTITRDITERTLAQEKLQESERKLREAQEMAHLGFWYWDVKTGAVEWSDEVFKIFFLDPKEFTPHIDSIQALSPWPEDHQRDKELIDRAMKNHSPGSYEQKFLRPDQSIGYYYSTFQGNYDENGDLISIVGTVLDVTERNLAEEKIHKLNAELEQKVVERTAELAAKTADLERINKVFVGRELRMRELKARINELEKK